MENKERVRMPIFLRNLSDLGLRNKDKQIMIRTPQQEASSPSNTEHNKAKQLQILKIEISLHNWLIPKVKKCEVYKQHKFWSSNQDQVHIVEYSYPRTKNNKVMNILEQSLLDQHIKDGYNFIHLGLTQVAAKPNYRLEINSPILIILRDIRLKKI